MPNFGKNFSSNSIFLVMSIMDSMRWSSLVPQGQCLLAPLILVILDTSKFCLFFLDFF